jgi:hypothetical protein
MEFEAIVVSEKYGEVWLIQSICDGLKTAIQ